MPIVCKNQNSYNVLEDDVAGQIVERSKGKYTLVFLGRDQETGRRRYLNRTVRGSKKDAQRVLTALLRDKDLGMLTGATRMRVKEYLEHWLEVAAKPSLTEHTHKRYAAQMRRYVYSEIGSRLTQLTPIEVQAVQDARAGRLQPKRPVAPHGAPHPRRS